MNVMKPNNTETLNIDSNEVITFKQHVIYIYIAQKIAHKRIHKIPEH